ncbi:hypothetical protein MKK70_08370 [Methylobacterium sp. E-041]|uniref:hypothetical protein n=1 Tax=Methylobacterium sp. E-041 TaxID=2836573 RepID=UPI001FB8B1F5|nr:hypothetical protein [Methylobacterium sp. E-041]MCJ2105393.1 hypothetical protein [Methylobacterium sp. E-041]
MAGSDQACRASGRKRLRKGCTTLSHWLEAGGRNSSERSLGRSIWPQLSAHPNGAALRLADGDPKPAFARNIIMIARLALRRGGGTNCEAAALDKALANASEIRRILAPVAERSAA